jgi:hypothetical protein
MTAAISRAILLVAVAFACQSVLADGPADTVTGGFRHAAPVNDPGDVIYTKRINAHEAVDGLLQHGFIYIVRPDGHTWEYIDLGDTDNACVNVYADGEARVGGLVTDGIGPGLGRYFGWALQDNGEPGYLADRTTTLRFVDVEGFFAWCATGDEGYADVIWPHIVVSGNLQVHNFATDGD